MPAAGSKIINLIFVAKDRTKGYFRDLNNELQKSKQNIASIAAGSLALGAAMAAPFVYSVKKAMDFEHSMAKVRAITGATEKDFEALTKTAKTLGRTTVFTASEAAEGLRLLAMAGLDAADSVAALPSVLQLAQAGAIELGQAADIATNIMTAYGFTADELVMVNDRLVGTFTNSNTNLVELGDAFKYVAPIARGMGADFEDLLASLGKMASAGLKASMAGTSLRGALAALFNPTKEEEKLLDRLNHRIKQMGGAGLIIKDVEGNFVGFGEVIRQLEMAGLKAEEALELFGLRAGPGMAALMQIGSKSIKQFTGELKDNKGIAEETAEIMDDTLYGAVKRLWSAIEGLSEAFGSPLLTPLKNFFDAISDGINTITDFLEANHNLAFGLNATLGILGGIFSVLGAVGLAFIAVKGPIILVWKVIGPLVTVLRAATLGIGAVAAAGAAASTGGLIALVVAAALATDQIIKLVTSFFKLKSIQKETQDAQKETAKVEEKIAAKLKEINEATGLQIKDMKEFNQAVKDNILVYDKQAGSWVNATKAINENIEAKHKALEKERELAQAVLDGAATRKKALELNERAAELEVRKIGGRKAEEDLLRVKVEYAQKEIKLAEEVVAAQKVMVGEEANEYKKAVLVKKKAGLDFLEANIELTEYLVEHSKQVAQAQQRLDLARYAAATKEHLAELSQLYRDGKIAVADYYSTRGEAIAAQYDREITSLNELLTAETDDIEKKNLLIQITNKESEQRLALAKNVDEETRAKLRLYEEEQRLIEMKQEAELRAAEAEVSTKPGDVDAAGQIALEQLKVRQEQELAALEDMVVAKENIAEKEMAIDSMKHAHKMELVAAEIELERASIQKRQEMQQEMAGTMAGIFGDLYTASGENVRAFFVLERAAAATQAIMSGEAAAMKALEQGGPYAMPLSIMLKVKGYTAAAAIMAQTLQSKAEGGEIEGRSPHPKADNIVIRATAGEFMHPVDAVKYYGRGVMELMRAKAIPKELFEHFRMPSSITQPQGLFQTGGAVTVEGSAGLSVNVPVSISDPNAAGLAGELQEGIEDTVLTILQRESR